MGCRILERFPLIVPFAHDAILVDDNRPDRNFSLFPRGLSEHDRLPHPMRMWIERAPQQIVIHGSSFVNLCCSRTDWPIRSRRSLIVSGFFSCFFAVGDPPIDGND